MRKPVIACSCALCCCCWLLKLGEKAGGRLVSECKQKLEEAAREMQQKAQQLKRAKQDRYTQWLGALQHSRTPWRFVLCISQ